MSYEDKLNNVSKTTKTTKDVLDVANAKAWLNFYGTLLILIGGTIIILFVVKKIMKKEVGNFWDFLVKPFRDLKARNRSANNIIGSPAQGVEPTLKTSDAKALADEIHACFGPIRDDESRLYELLRNGVKNASDWEMVKGQFGSRHCPKLASARHEGTLEHVISHNFTEREKNKVREILNPRGIYPTL